MQRRSLNILIPQTWRTIRPLTQAVLTLCILCVLCVKTSSQDYKSVHDGVEYAELTREISSKPVKMNLLRLDLKKVRLDVHHAMDMAIGTETTSSIAKRHGAVAAINAGFFRLDKSIRAGESAGALVIDGLFLSESYGNRIALGLFNERNKSRVLFDYVKTNVAIAYNDLSRKFEGLNREPRPKEMILHTMKETTPVTSTKQPEIVLYGCQRFCRRSSVIESNGGTIVPDDGYVISFGENADNNYILDYFKEIETSQPTHPIFIFDYIETPKTADDKRFEKVEDIVAGVPQLIRKGKIDITWEQEKASKSFVETRHPRTAVAKLKDGKFLMVTVDGRSAESAGIDLYDMAKLLLEFGATDAMNLDGGGSTTMFLDGKVVNKPSDPTGERKVGDAILVTLRKPTRK